MLQRTKVNNKPKYFKMNRMGLSTVLDISTVLKFEKF